jgi:hypothetical protein
MQAEEVEVLVVRALLLLFVVAEEVVAAAVIHGENIFLKHSLLNC